MDKYKDIITKVLEDTINDIFLEVQERENITDGGIDPWYYMKLEEARDDLTDKIMSILADQKSRNMYTIYRVDLECIGKPNDKMLFDYLTETVTYHANTLLKSGATMEDFIHFLGDFTINDFTKSNYTPNIIKAVYIEDYDGTLIDGYYITRNDTLRKMI